MAQKKSSIEAGKKRSIARRFNSALAGRSTTTKNSDKRTDRRLDRYRKELAQGTAKGKALTPLDIAMRVHELIEHGEKLTTLRKVVKPREGSYDRNVMAELLREMHPVYEYRAEAYRFAGVDDETLLAAGIIEKLPKKRGPKPGSRKKN